MFKDISINELFKMAHNGNKDVRDYLITSNLKLVYKIAQRYSMNSTIDKEIFIQEGSIGLIKAVDGFRPELGFQFSTYAVRVIQGELNNCIRDSGIGKPYRIKRRDRKTYKDIQIAKNELREALLREPTLDEISKEIQVDPKEIEIVTAVMDGYESIHEVVYEGKDTQVITRLDMIENKNNLSEEQLINIISIKDQIKNLTEEQKKVIELRFFKGLSQRQAARELDTYQIKILRIEKKALNRLREII